MTNLVKNPFAKYDDKATDDIAIGTRQIYDGINEAQKKKEKYVNVNRCSAASYHGDESCVRQKQLRGHGAEGKPMAPRAYINFDLGNHYELECLALIKEWCTGEGKIYSEVYFGEEYVTIPKEISNTLVDITYYHQPEWSFKIGKQVITGHPDGIGKRNSDGKWELIEVKSASNWGYKSFEKDGKCGYLGQGHSLMLCEQAEKLKIDSIRFWYGRKETGHPHQEVFKYNEKIAQEVIDNYVKAASDEYIAPPFPLVDETFRRKPTGRKIAAYPCTYCDFIKECHGEYTIDWKPTQCGNKKPVFVFEGEKRKKTPPPAAKVPSTPEDYLKQQLREASKKEN